MRLTSRTSHTQAQMNSPTFNLMLVSLCAIPILMLSGAPLQAQSPNASVLAQGSNFHLTGVPLLAVYSGLKLLAALFSFVHITCDSHLHVPSCYQTDTLLHSSP